MGRTKGGGKNVEGIIHVAEAKDRRRGEAGGRKLGRGGWDNGMGEVACQVQPEDDVKAHAITTRMHVPQSGESGRARGKDAAVGRKVEEDGKGAAEGKRWKRNKYSRAVEDGGDVKIMPEGNPGDG